MREQIEWMTGAPLWRELSPGSQLRKPVILRFADDAFMEQLDGVLRTRPDELGAYVARTETWNAERVGLTETNGPGPLKLYQPVHGRHYLVAAALCCRRYGYPDRCVDATAAESTTYVLRRLGRTGEDGIDLAKPGSYYEYAWSDGAWARADADAVMAGEERLPLFALRYPDGDRTRRLLAGTIPVGGRERFEAASDPTPIEGFGEDPLADPTLHELRERVVGALRQVRDDIESSPRPQENAARHREVLAFALLDFADLLEFLPDVLPDAEPGAGQVQTVALRTLLGDADFGESTWLAALRTIGKSRTAIEDGTASEAGAGPVGELTNNQISPAIAAVLGEPSGEPLVELVRNALEEAATANPSSDPGGEGGAPPFERPPPEDPAGDGSGAMYWIRCVYERPSCTGPQHQVISSGSEPFLLASFFDPGAPYRPVNIPLPVDTSVSGLRKFPRNVSLLISRQLREQMQRVQGVGLGALDEGEINEEGSFDWGMICSLSIPIISICALILLMILVLVLNIVFWWLPFFKICRPVDR